MKKVIYSILSVLFIVGLAACGSSNPWVGEWTPSDDTRGSSWVTLKSDGSVEMITDTDDGYAKIKGKWSEIPEKENTIKIEFDPKTMELDFDNPLVEMIVAEALREQVSKPGEFILIDDGNRMKNTKKVNAEFIRK